jgi:hypothetical protein
LFRGANAKGMGVADEGRSVNATEPA